VYPHDPHHPIFVIYDSFFYSLALGCVAAEPIYLFIHALLVPLAILLIRHPLHLALVILTALAAIIPGRHWLLLVAVLFPSLAPPLRLLIPNHQCTIHLKYPALLALGAHGVISDPQLHQLIVFVQLLDLCLQLSLLAVRDVYLVKVLGDPGEAEFDSCSIRPNAKGVSEGDTGPDVLFLLIDFKELAQDSLKFGIAFVSKLLV
jgi:hypothetical protein